MSRLPLLLLLLGVSLTPAAGLEFKIENLVGDVRIRVVIDEKPSIQQNNRNRPAKAGDVQVERDGDVVKIICRPNDGSPIDLDLALPFNSAIDVQTHDGKVTFVGMPTVVTVQTMLGDIDVTAPWNATKFLMVTVEEPKQTVFPKGFKFRVERTKELEDTRWIVQDKLKDDVVTYGRVRIRSQRTKNVTLRQMPLPPEAPVKMHWQAADALESLLSSAPTGRDAALLERRPQAVNDAGGKALATGDVLFSSDVRMVAIPAAVYDASGTPLTGLTKDDFEILEGGAEQKIEAAETEQAPFNLAILLDLSASTRRDRGEMKDVARHFIGIARPQDKVALYALFNSWFGVLASLTDDHDAIARGVESLPPLAGASPLYDSMLLSYTEELDKHRGERNALIVISDGLDNRIYGIGVPSKIDYGDLLKAAERMDAILYPVFLGPPEDKIVNRSYPDKALTRFKELAAATGGRVFAASSIKDLQSVYEQVAEELRSVYSLTYYPSNQNFDGGVRDVQVRVKRPGAQVRARSSYVAR